MFSLLDEDLSHGLSLQSTKYKLCKIDGLKCIPKHNFQITPHFFIPNYFLSNLSIEIIKPTKQTGMECQQPAIMRDQSLIYDIASCPY